MKQQVFQDGSGNVTHIEEENWTWSGIKQERESFLVFTDQFMLSDRFATYTESQQNELLAYRQAWRDITNYFDADDEDSQGANEAGDNFPTMPSWLVN